MNIPVYNTLEEKSSHFKHHVIDTLDDLNEFRRKWSTKDDTKNYIFRGVNNARYKLYTSGQRAWMGQELDKLGDTYHDFIQKEIDYAKNFQSGLLMKFYKAFGHHAYDFSILSFLQHYNAPTPLLDFSYNFDCSLYFALDALSHYPNDGIDNYFSIYAIDTRQHEFSSIVDHLQSQTKNLQNILSPYPEYLVDDNGVIENLQTLNYSYLEELRLFWLPGYSGAGIPFSIPSRPHFRLVYNQNNLNIINQEGLFVFNSSPDQPLEDFFMGRLTKSSTPFSLKKIECWDIHKSFNKYLKAYLNAEGKTKEFIYPQEEYIAAGAFSEFKRKR